jgi:hypothetical protein
VPHKTKPQTGEAEPVERIPAGHASARHGNGAPKDVARRSDLRAQEKPVAPKAETGGCHPLAPLAGKYNDAEWWDEYLQAIEEYRQEVNAAGE